MTITLALLEDVLDCVAALIAAGRVYRVHRLGDGTFEITTRD